MRVKALVSFSSMVGGELVPWPVGHVAELPAGVNWLELGWVEPMAGEPSAEPIPEPPAKARKSKAAKKDGDL